ncbi:MAG: hypothetical protein AAF266_05575 [Planctomycetota bacterium]
MSSLWDRIAIVGCSVAGKSTLARRLSGATGAEHIVLDDLGLGPNLQTRPLEDFRADVDRATAGDQWIADGNWSPVRDLVWGRATAIVWPDPPMLTCFRRVFIRTLYRSFTGVRVCNSNRESLWNAFATRESILLWVL